MGEPNTTGRAEAALRPLTLAAAALAPWQSYSEKKVLKVEIKSRAISDHTEMLACLLLAAGAARRSAVLTAAKAQPTTQLLFHERLIAGAGARGIAQTCLHPIDVVRTRVQAKGVSLNLSPQTFLKGVAPQFFLAFPAGALQFAAYEFSKAKCAALDIVGAPAEVRAAARPRRARAPRLTCAPSARRFCPAQSARWGRRSCACPRRCSSSACRLTSTRTPRWAS